MTGRHLNGGGGVRPLLIGICGALAACSGLQSRSAPTVVYTLNAPVFAPDQASLGGRLRAFALQIERPDAGPGLGGAQIALRRADNRLDYFAASVWAAPLPQLLEALLLETLRSSARLGTVHDDRAPFASDFLLRIGIRRFDADYSVSAAAPVIRVAFDCAIGTRADRRVIDQFSVTAESPAAANRLTAVIGAFEVATQRALLQIADRTF
ncbi:MAG: ABC-type transport auxiliary lipoprotein family protein, partial [Steroidobacteraceae bacterium]|nr:ABC-type transport auxiliary lipoprotein family protein [Steroidobacteraceae bacterium]